MRIRGKLGQLSRTEPVALALKQKAHDEMEVVNAQLATLQKEAREHARFSRDCAISEILRAAFDALPEAVLVACDKGMIRYRNARLESMFGYKEGERSGLDKVVYAQRKNGEFFRIVLPLDSSPTSTGSIIACILRDFATEIQTRRQYASAWS